MKLSNYVEKLPSFVKRLCKLEKIVAGSGGIVDWDTLEEKPEEFPPSSHEHPFTEITGTAATAQIPNLPASKIASGTFAAARIPQLPMDRVDNLETILEGKQDTLTPAIFIEILQEATPQEIAEIKILLEV